MPVSGLPSPDRLDAASADEVAAERIRWLAFGALLLGAAATACAPILVRLSDVSPTASAFWRVMLAAPLLWAWVFVLERGARNSPTQDANLPHNRRWSPAMLVAGFFFACDLGAWHLAIAWTSVANATLEANFAPVFVTLGAWLLWDQRPRASFVIALVVTLAGATLLVGPNFEAGGRAWTGDILGTLTGLFYAGYMLSIKSASERRPSTARLMAVSTSVTALLLAPYAALTATNFIPQSGAGWLWVLALAVIPHVAGQGLIAFGFAHLPAALSSVSQLLQAVLAALLAWLLLGEAMLPQQMIGGIVVLLGIYLARRFG